MDIFWKVKVALSRVRDEMRWSEVKLLIFNLGEAGFSYQVVFFPKGGMLMKNMKMMKKKKKKLMMMMMMMIDKGWWTQFIFFESPFHAKPIKGLHSPASKDLIQGKKAPFFEEKLLEKPIEEQRNGKKQFWKKPDTLVSTSEHWDMPMPLFIVE